MLIDGIFINNLDYCIVLESCYVFYKFFKKGIENVYYYDDFVVFWYFYEKIKF